ncbi:MAG: Hsp20/alpha crystallin family protein [Saprospiraceae bacterium]
MSNLVNFNSGINSIFDDLFNNSFSNFVGSDFASNVPSVNISESADNFKIELAAPGLQKENFNINVEKNTLTISAKKKEEANDTDGEKFTRKEFSYSTFSRSFQLSEDVESNAIAANYESGILAILLPKKEEAKELPPRAIQVN